MNRRDFLRQVSAWTSGLTLAAPLFNVGSILAADEKPAGQPVISVARGQDYAALVKKTLEPLGGIKSFVKSGDRVVVKPNIGWDRKPEQGANTNPDVVKAVVLLCLDAGAKQVLVFDRPVNEARRCYANSGIQAAVQSINDPKVQCVFQDQGKFVPVKIDSGKSINQFDFYKDSLASDCDCYINLPIAKHHRLAKLTLGLKNIMGVIGGNRGEIHKDIHQRVADLNLVVKPRLTIIDATRILLKNGPSGGKIEDVKVLDTLMASTDIVAVDAYATKLFDMKPEDLGATVAAAKLGLGEIDLSKVKIIGV